MARLARVVVPGYPHHITQRGNRRLETFFSDADYEAYLHLMAEQCAAHDVRIWAWCLMPNHVHLVAVPRTAEGLARAVGEAASAVHASHQLPRGLARVPVARAVRLVRHGRGARFGGGAVRGAESGAGAASRACVGLAVVERSGARERAGRCVGAREPAGGGGVELAAVFEDRGGRGGVGGDPSSWADRPAVGRLGVPQEAGEAPGPTAPPPKTWGVKADKRGRN